MRNFHCKFAVLSLPESRKAQSLQLCTINNVDDIIAVGKGVRVEVKSGASSVA
jgi:hypothetical protein